jgi:hypothetical protein
MKELSPAKEAAIRRAITEGAIFATTTPAPGALLGHRVLVPRPALTDCYTVNPVGTLRVLDEIVRTGKPQAAIFAAAYMRALEGNPVFAAMDAHLPADKVDLTGEDAPNSLRITLVAEAKKMLEAAEKREKEKNRLPTRLIPVSPRQGIEKKR